MGQIWISKNVIQVARKPEKIKSTKAYLTWSHKMLLMYWIWSDIVYNYFEFHLKCDWVCQKKLWLFLSAEVMDIKKDRLSMAPHCLPRIQEIVVPVVTENTTAPHDVPKQKQNKMLPLDSHLNKRIIYPWVKLIKGF